ncbi:ATP-dependent DNA ligase [Candidatus Dojkabacteria bacterium]|uniref:DNA ligase (ATP) n=1 Tax=Candidatus Dojkabacteria bacterium TaxID=2099670 RepID=A0A955RM05_9BACT|nr:ATP-dependent DNA ligase [Candidatus Dojkabacteria bacterium]
MKFKDFSEYLLKLENIASRNDMTTLLADLFKGLDKSEVKEAFYLLNGRLAPKFVDLEFNYSRKLILKALGSAINSEAEVSALFKQKGDVGLVAEVVKESHPNLSVDGALFNEGDNSSELSITEVFEKLKQIANFEGKGSQESKIQSYIELVNQLDSVSCRYVTRIIIGELRLGISDKTLLDALSWFISGDKSNRKLLDQAFGYKADIGELAELVITSDEVILALEKISLTPGIPLASKLVERESTAESVWDRMPNCFVQPKLDGLRGQLHFYSNRGAVFSRNMENMTEHFPDLVQGLKQLNVDSIILDSEIVGYDVKKQGYLTYQETMQRRRKYDVEEYAASIPVRAMCFDVLYLNGQDLTQTPIEERIEKLKKLLGNAADSDSLHMLETLQMESVEELSEYFEEKVMSGLEGIITKETRSNYEPGTRNYKWIKLKANTKSELVDTLDVAVLGYYTGRGQRAKFGLGAILTGIYDPKTDKYYSVGKVGTGITDEMFMMVAKDLKPLELEKKPENYEVDSTLYPDVWVEPKIIIEIDADEITRSTNHTAAKGIETNIPKDKPDRGLSVRFPRLKIWNRDKEYPNTVEELVRIYELRKNKT